MVGDGDGLEVEVLHAVDLELEGERRLQVPVNAVLGELEANKHNTRVCWLVNGRDQNTKTPSTVAQTMLHGTITIYRFEWKNISIFQRH